MSSSGFHRTLAAAALLLMLGVASCKSPTSSYGGGGGGYGGGGGGGTGGGGGGGAGTLFNFGPFAIGQSAKLAFATAGTFGYHCIPHQSMGMTGTVQVDDSGVDSAVVQVGSGGYSFSPATAHIKPAGYVRWVNVSALSVHTVTSNN